MPLQQVRELSPASSRRKSCSECVKAKRRCTLQLPSCIRCTKQNLPCQYYGQQPNTLNQTSLQITLARKDRRQSTPILTTQANDPRMTSMITQSELDLLTMNTLPFIDNFMVSSMSQLTSPTIYAPSIVGEASFGPMPKAWEPRFKYAIKQLELTPSSMVRENQTPWSHPLLYDDFMPKSIQGTSSSA
jgi:Fungal Zn(2)-Cys(6) binuclear cluster domain